MLNKTLNEEVDNKFIKYFATHGRGIDEFTKKELINLNNNSSEIVARIESYVEGKICFESILKPNDLIKKLKTIERLFISILFLNFDDCLKYKSIDDLLSLISFFNFNEKLIHVGLNREDEDLFLKEKKPRFSLIKYRINCKLTGKWRDTDRRLVWQKLQKKFENEFSNSNNFEISEIDPNFEIICHVTNDCIACGIQLHKNSLAIRSYVKHVGLRSTICAIMLQMADLETNKYKVVCDPFCGKGTIIAEYFGSYANTCYFLMSDMSDDQIQFSQENTVYFSQNLDLLKICIKQNVHLPYIDQSVDIIITDLPFNKQHSIHESFRDESSPNHKENFYIKIINEFKRIIVKDEGIIIILINRNDMKLFEDSIKKSNENNDVIKFKIIQVQKLDLGETPATVYKLSTY
jgi:tRNA G10  N-methylase Trm11